MKHDDKKWLDELAPKANFGDQILLKWEEYIGYDYIPTLNGTIYVVWLYHEMLGIATKTFSWMLMNFLNKHSQFSLWWILGFYAYIHV